MRAFNRRLATIERAAQRALDAFYNEQYARERREKLAQAKEAFDRKRAAKYACFLFQR